MSTQIEKVRAHLHAGKSITPASALMVYGIYRLSSVIEDLRNTGMEIDCVLKFDEAGKQYGEYRLRKPVTLGSEVQVKRGHGYSLPNWVRRLKNAKVVGKQADTSLVHFIRGRNSQCIWMNDKELVHAS